MRTARRIHESFRVLRKDSIELSSSAIGVRLLSELMKATYGLAAQSKQALLLVA